MPAVLLLVLISVACVTSPTATAEVVSAPPGSVTQSEGERIGLRVGASTRVAGTEATVTFVRVQNESRCPTGVTCVWEGDAVVVLRLQTGAGGAETLELHANPRFAQQGSAQGVHVVLERLEPYPEADRPVPPDAYLATLRISSK